MAYWWVSQNKTFSLESKGGYLWAPKQDADGNVPFHWKNMEYVQPGDIIFSYFKQAIAAVSIALGSEQDADKPDAFDKGEAWETKGSMVSCRYLVLPERILRKTLPVDILSILSGEYLPLNAKGTGNQSYLFRIPPEAGRKLLEIAEGKLGVSLPLLENGSAGATKFHKAVAETERESLILSRVGQGQFREDLLDLWGSKCCVTGLAIPAFLRASHSKPWKDSNNAERLNKYNGLLLSPVLDAAFDRGFITFKSDGVIVLSSTINSQQWDILGIHSGMKIARLSAEHLPFIAHHNKHVFVL